MRLNFCTVRKENGNQKPILVGLFIEQSTPLCFVFRNDFDSFVIPRDKRIRFNSWPSLRIALFRLPYRVANSLFPFGQYRLDGLHQMLSMVALFPNWWPPAFAWGAFQHMHTSDEFACEGRSESSPTFCIG